MDSETSQVPDFPGKPNHLANRQLLSIKEVCKLSGLGRTFINEELRCVRLKSIKLRKRRMIRYSDYLEWLDYYATR